MNTPTEMSFAEVVEFSGYERRQPTEKEIELVLDFIVSGELQYRLKRGEVIPTTLINEEVEKIKESYEADLRSTGYIMSFPAIGKTILYFHHMKVKLIDHDNPIIEANVAEIKQVIMDAMEQMGKPLSKHNHITITYFALRVEKGKVSLCSHSVNDLCLATTK